MSNWLWAEAKMLNPLEPKCLMGLCKLKPLHLLAPPSLLLHADGSDAGVMQESLPYTALCSSWENCPNVPFHHLA